MKVFILLLAMAASKLLSAQILYHNGEEDIILPVRQSLKFAPINLYDFVNPSLEASYEYQLKPKLTAQLSLAGILNNSFWEIEKVDEFIGFRVRLEVRNYFSLGDESDARPAYFAIEVAHHYSEENKVLRFENENFYNYIPNDSSGITYEIHVEQNTYNDSVIVFRNMSILNFKVGLQEALSRNFVIDIYVGLGLKYRTVTHHRRLNKEHQFYQGELYNNPRRDRARSSIVPSLPFNIKIGYRF